MSSTCKLSTTAATLSKLGLCLVLGTASIVAEEPATRDAAGRGGAWQAQGPGPNTLGQVENISDGEVVGAIHTAAPHPTDPDVLYAGAVNGGIWRTVNATAASPTWVQQTDPETSLSIGALEFDPTDATFRTLVAGIGRFSSFRRIGGPRAGLLRTTNGGATWTSLDGAGILIGRNISGVAARGSTLVVSVNVADLFLIAEYGIFRSTDTGATFTQISDGDGSATGLPAGATHDLAGDPSDPTRLFTGVDEAEQAGGQSGIYRSTDTGATWAKVSDAAIDAVLNAPNTHNVEIAVGPSGAVFVIIANNGQTDGVFRSGDGGDTWAAMDLPGTTSLGINPGYQGSRHLSIAADPTDPNLVYVGGDRQSFPNQVVPNEIGATDFTGNLFRGNASAAPGSQWQHLTHSNTMGPAGGGTASSSAPHADSRELVFDAAGDLIETDDGGIYRRTSPRDNTGDWFSINGNIQTTEMYHMAYDANADVIIGGAQDTGTPAQLVPGMNPWFSVSTGNGGDVAVDDTSTPGFSVRYSSAQSLINFRRQVYDADNVLQSETFPALTVIGGGNPLKPQSITPIAVNAVDGTRLLIGGESLYESFDQGDTIMEISPFFSINGGTKDPVAYGTADNPDVIYFGSDVRVWVRTGPPPAPVTHSSLIAARAIEDVVIDPDNSTAAFAVDELGVYRTTDAATTWSEITGNLPALEPGALRSITYVNNSAEDGIVVGSDNGVFVALEIDGFSFWTPLGTHFPRAPVFELDYHPATDLLVAGTLGRGAFTLTPTLVAPDSIFSDGFESGNAASWSLSEP